MYWLTAILGFLAVYAGAGLCFVLTRPGPVESDSAGAFSVILVVCAISAVLLEMRVRRRKRKSAAQSAGPN